jgi:hypothetical protein
VVAEWAMAGARMLVKIAVDEFVVNVITEQANRHPISVDVQQFEYFRIK